MFIKFNKIDSEEKVIINFNDVSSIADGGNTSDCLGRLIPYLNIVFKDGCTAAVEGTLENLENVINSIDLSRE